MFASDLIVGLALLGVVSWLLVWWVCDCCRLVVRIWLLGLLISAVLWLGDCGFVLRWC